MSLRRHTVVLESMRTVQQTNRCVKRMQCPYLSSTSKKECVKMLAANIEEELSEFDLEHFCDGNPVFCYYFRLPALELATKRVSETKVLLEALQKETPVPALTNEPVLKEEKRLWQK